MVENRESTNINNILFDDLRKIVKPGRRVPKEMRWGQLVKGGMNFLIKSNKGRKIKVGDL